MIDDRESARPDEASSPHEPPDTDQWLVVARESDGVRSERLGQLLAAQGIQVRYDGFGDSTAVEVPSHEYERAMELFQAAQEQLLREPAASQRSRYFCLKRGLIVGCTLGLFALSVAVLVVLAAMLNSSRPVLWEMLRDSVVIVLCVFFGGTLLGMLLAVFQESFIKR